MCHRHWSRQGANPPLKWKSMGIVRRSKLNWAEWLWLWLIGLILMVILIQFLHMMHIQIHTMSMSKVPLPSIGKKWNSKAECLPRRSAALVVFFTSHSNLQPVTPYDSCVHYGLKTFRFFSCFLDVVGLQIITSDEVQIDTAACLTHDTFHHIYTHLLHGRICVLVKSKNLAGTSRYFTIQIHTRLPPFVRPHWHTYFRMHIQIYTYR